MLDKLFTKLHSDLSTGVINPELFIYRVKSLIARGLPYNKEAYSFALSLLDNPPPFENGIDYLKTSLDEAQRYEITSANKEDYEMASFWRDEANFIKELIVAR